MGCSASKNITISNNLAFSNGKIIQKDGNYFLERNRYHDKLLPKVQKKFESFLQKQIEQLNNEAKNNHEQKALKNQNTKKGKEKGRHSHSREGHRKSMMVTDTQRKNDTTN